MQRTQHSFIKNVKERKEHNALFIKNTKERENVCSFEKNGCPTLQWVYPIGTWSAFFYIYLSDLICTVPFICTVFIFQFIFWCTENFPSICGKFSLLKHMTGNFPSICGKFSLLKNMNWKFSVYLWETFIAQKYELEKKHK